MHHVLLITKALSDESRLRVLMALRQGEMCLNDLTDLLTLTPSTVSRHMSILRDAGLVTGRREGKWHYYRLSKAGASEARGALRWLRTALRDEPRVESDHSWVTSRRRAGATPARRRSAARKAAQGANSR
jgi:DNA-binding transcriptional ArsR family regulator